MRVEFVYVVQNGVIERLLIIDSDWNVLLQVVEVEALWQILAPR